MSFDMSCVSTSAPRVIKMILAVVMQEAAIIHQLLPLEIGNVSGWVSTPYRFVNCTPSNRLCPLSSFVLLNFELIAPHIGVD